ncbi:glycine/D-amino acid oxidase-like deaminating enzyme [Stella humosa]|uniref:Glycine/D-amino acid oxidase-like deaminating enzyme n=1 Tax=Stella humosa TaxID=94 RepID=A0A3N1M7X7_9PROT|nr:FAD-binding oxidoreductase [Stella humosa]ROQ01932.1 glycine/D-amino acid oxidase-like deaminating enzyme [Stella humosa]BBK32321.1 hypothetical protein STHU_29550 [Stella humosa]
MSAILAPGFRAEPYWWEAAPLDREPSAEPLPARADVAIVGAGYAGLSTAIELARAGRSVVVLDAGPAGGGASSRSVGMIGGRLRQGHAALAADIGETAALDLMRETAGAYRWFLDFVGQEGIDCDLAQSGRIVGAWTRADLHRQQRLAAFLVDRLGIRAHAVDRGGLAGEISTDLYHGALVLPDDGGLHPARLHAGLLRLAQAAGARVFPFTAVEALKEDGDRVAVATARGRLVAGEAVLATNAYTGPAFAWHHRRVIPVGSYMAATAPLDPALVRRLLPRGRLVNDTRRLAYALRASPDGTRILLGGRASARDHASPPVVARSLHRLARTVFPELASARISHAWGGMVGFTVDRLPNIGTRGRIHHVLGCNGSGVVLSTYLGCRLGRRIAGLDDAPTGFARDGLPTHPLFAGTAWFMSPLSAWYGVRDRVDRLTDRFRSHPRA